MLKKRDQSVERHKEVKNPEQLVHQHFCSRPSRGAAILKNQPDRKRKKIAVGLNFENLSDLKRCFCDSKLFSYVENCLQGACVVAAKFDLLTSRS